MIEAGLEAVIDNNTRLIILGTFPSVKSRNGGYYHNPLNQFWKIVSYICKDEDCLPYENEKEEELIAKRKAFLKKHQLGLWDVIASCEIKGSDDNSIKDTNYNNLSILQRQCPHLKSIAFSSQKAFKHYKKYLKQTEQYQELNDENFRRWLEQIVCKEVLPSPSPANARISLAQKKQLWAKILNNILSN